METHFYFRKRLRRFVNAPPAYPYAHSSLLADVDKYVQYLGTVCTCINSTPVDRDENEAQKHRSDSSIHLLLVVPSLIPPRPAMPRLDQFKTRLTRSRLSLLAYYAGSGSERPFLPLAMCQSVPSTINTHVYLAW